MSNYKIEPYGKGFIVADYSGNRGKFGAAYAGKTGEWHIQPIALDPFATEDDAEKFILLQPDGGQK